ncbi:hypothetical protein, partial [Cronobacter sakazakii]|uniref:hypothetical protein n=2 Tax=Cronobacter sakazakii TaxID=28141 RepID=UPI000A11A582
MNKIKKVLSFKGHDYQKASKLTFGNKLFIININKIKKRCEQSYHFCSQDNFMHSVDKSVQNSLRKTSKTRRSARYRC